MTQVTRVIAIFLWVLFAQMSIGQTVFRGTVLDEDTQEPIRQVRVGVLGQGVGEITNDEGNFTYRKYHEVLDNESRLKVSVKGYKTLTNDVSVIRKMMNNRGVIYLKKEISNHVLVKKDKKVAIFWDASKRPKNRNIKLEKRYLRAYLEDNSISQVRITAFNEEIIFSEIFTDPTRAFANIEAKLNMIEYKGFSDFEHIQYAAVDEVILFSQHPPVVGTPYIDQEVPFHTVNFNAKAQAVSYFKKIASFTSGKYHDSMDHETEAIKTPFTISETTISGRVSTSNEGVNYALVVKEGSIEEYYTNEAGDFEIPAREGDVLRIYCLGHYSKKVTLTDQKKYTIALTPKAEILDEVILKGQTSKAPEYAFNKDKQTDKIGNRTVPVRTIYKEDFRKNAINIAGLIDGWFGINSKMGPDGSNRTNIRGKCIRFLVDGIEVHPDQINSTTIERITVFNPYSIIPCPARVIITTRYHPDIIDQKLRRYGIDPLKNNNYTEEVPVLENTNNEYFQESNITGTVYSNATPIQNASILIQGTLKEYITDTKGQFLLAASEGDILMVKHLGMYPETVLVTEQKNYEVTLATKSEILAEVQLSKKVKKIETTYDRYIPERRIEVVNGKKYDVRKVFFKEDLNMAGEDIYEMIRMASSRIIVEVDQKTFQKTIFFKTGRALEKIPLQTIVDGRNIDVASVNPLMVERVSVYVAPLRNYSKIFITTRNNPDAYKKFLEDSDITLKNNRYTEAVGSLEEKENTYFKEKIIQGVVRSNNKILPQASVFRKGTLEEVITNREGVFTISVTPGDVLEVKHLGMHPKMVLVTSDDTYDIALKSKTEILEAVALENNKEAQKEIIFQETAYGKKNRNAVGYKVEDQAAKYIAINDIDFMQVANKLPGVVVDQQTQKMMFQRSMATINEPSAIQFMVDGTPVSQQTIRIINPQIITNITLLKSVAATNKYGMNASFGGVILITTKNNTKGDFNRRQVNDITLKGNIYKEEVPTLNFDAIQASYIDDITREESTKIKLKTYHNLKADYIDKVDFYVDMTLYFQQLDAGVASIIRSDFAQIAGDNIKALRILAYLNEHAGEYLNAQKVYERILELAPSQAQSYRDLAFIYQETGEYNKSLELYINMLGDQVKGVEFAHLEVPISNELRRLISLHKNKIDYSRLPNDWLAVDFNIDVRLTLDWSDPNAPFEFQFVNPKKKFYTWQSSNQGQGSERSNLSEEFIVDDAASGKWLVNVRYTGQEDEIHIPPYLKYTIYKDFGTPQEEKMVKLVRLDTQLDKVTLDSFVY